MCNTLASKIENESDAAGNLNCGNSARKRLSTSKLYHVILVIVVV